MTPLAEQLALEVERSGGMLQLKANGGIGFMLPPDAGHLLPLLRAHKEELLPLLRRNAGYIRAFPCCPQCGSHYLYRRNGVGLYECQSCGLPAIEESAARKAGAARDAVAGRSPRGETDSGIGNHEGENRDERTRSTYA